MSSETGYVNHGYTGPEAPGDETDIPEKIAVEEVQPNEDAKKTNEDASKKRDKWGNDIEFLMSCIAMSVGLGNVWRFPFTALSNGGGAFVIPYIIVLFVVGKPIYYLEMILGQFSSKGSIKVYDFAPIMRGSGYGQFLCTVCVTTYYSSLMALTIRYFIASFSSPLPWSYCHEGWTNCLSSLDTIANQSISNMTKITSAELYFTEEVLAETDSIHDGIGLPDWRLTLCLAFSWTFVAVVLIRGINSSGKASYFLAIFPYIILLILLGRAASLPGAVDGIIYFIKPQWSELLNLKVWYAAVIQVFFSLAICLGNVVMYSSYNRFSHNVLRDATIVTTLDTLTSLLAGFTIFGVLGNLAYVTGTSDVKNVVKAGFGLAFVSYPNAISKFDFVPQLFAVLFFLMLFVLGIGSNVGMASVAMTVIRDQFPSSKHWVVIVFVASFGFLVGLVYLTPGGQYILNLVDYFGASFVSFILAIGELIAVGWLYGVKRLCKDIEFMLGIKTGIYWRLCWGVITPILMIAILIYTLVEMDILKYRDYIYPDSAYIFGWCLSAFGILQLPIWAIYAISRQKEGGIWKKIVAATKPNKKWGPLDDDTMKQYQAFIAEEELKPKRTGIFGRMYDNIFG